MLFLHFFIISDIAEKFHLELSKEEINQMTTKYDIKKNGKFAYYDFFQSCILLLKPQKSTLLQRVIIPKPQKPVHTMLIKIKITLLSVSAAVTENSSILLFNPMMLISGIHLVSPSVWGSNSLWSCFRVPKLDGKLAKCAKIWIITTSRKHRTWSFKSFCWTK